MLIIMFCAGQAGNFGPWVTYGVVLVDQRLLWVWTRGDMWHQVPIDCKNIKQSFFLLI